MLEHMDYGFLYDDNDYDYVIKPKTKKPTFWSLFKAKNPRKGRNQSITFKPQKKSVIWRDNVHCTVSPQKLKLTFFEIIFSRAVPNYVPKGPA